MHGHVCVAVFSFHQMSLFYRLGLIELLFFRVDRKGLVSRIVVFATVELSNDWYKGEKNLFQYS